MWRSLAVGWLAAAIFAASPIGEGAADGTGNGSDGGPPPGLASGLPAWQQVFPQHTNRDHWNTKPRTRYSHTATVLGDQLLMAFGYYYDHWDGGKTTWLREVWAVSKGGQGSAHGEFGYTWRRIWEGKSGDGGPQGRMNHVAARHPADERLLVVYGGTGFKDEKFRDMWQFDPQSVAWTQIRPVNDPPPERVCFSATILRDSLVIYGGFRKGDLWRYKFSSGKWKLLMDTPTTDRSDHPGKRAAHSAVAATNGREMYVFGGFRFKDDVSDPDRFPTGKLGDMWLYSTDTNSWQEIQQVNPQGGRQYFAMELLRWPIESKDILGLTVFGGTQCNPNCSLVGNMQFFSLEERQWTTIKVQNQPMHRYHHSMTMFQDHLWIFGGESFNPYMYHNSLERFPWPPVNVPLVENVQEL